MILVGQFDSPFVRRVAVTLNHYHMPFTRNAISVFRNIPELQKINPLIRVPCLILESGETLIDSSAIIDHLDEMAGPARALTPAHGPQRRKVLQAVVMALGTTDKAVALFYERLFHIDKHINRDLEKRVLSQIRAGLDRLVQARMRFDAGRARGGIVGRLQQAAAAASGAINFVRLYFHPVKRHDLPAQIRVAPSW